MFIFRKCPASSVAGQYKGRVGLCFIRNGDSDASQKILSWEKTEREK